MFISTLFCFLLVALILISMLCMCVFSYYIHVFICELARLSVYQLGISDPPKLVHRVGTVGISGGEPITQQD